MAPSIPPPPYPPGPPATSAPPPPASENPPVPPVATEATCKASLLNGQKLVKVESKHICRGIVFPRRTPGVHHFRSPILELRFLLFPSVIRLNPTKSDHTRY